MTNSDLFKNFIKIAEEKAHQKQSEETAKAIRKNQNSASSTTTEQIAKLYNIKTETSKDMEYKTNIMEIAHPNTVVISPAYDRLNGMVGSEIEKQNITINKINRLPHGQYLSKKYAKNLALSLVRIANSTESKSPELTKLADEAIEQIKIALAPMVIGTSIAATLGFLYYANHCESVNHGFEINHRNLLDSLDDLINPVDGVLTGYEYSDNLKRLLADFKLKLSSLYDSYKEVDSLVDQLEQPKTTEELKEIAAKPETKEILVAYKNYASKINSMEPYVRKILTNFSSDDYKARNIKDKGYLQQAIDAVPGLHGGSGFIADDFDDVVQNLKPYWKSVKYALDLLGKAGTFQAAAKHEIEAAEEVSEEPAPQEEISEDPESWGGSGSDIASKLFRSIQGK